MACGNADALNIRGTDALLAGGNTLSRRGHFTRKILFHRGHAGVDQKKAIVILRNQREARQAQMSLRLKERKILFSEII